MQLWLLDSLCSNFFHKLFWVFLLTEDPKL